MKKRYKFLKKHINEFIETYKKVQGDKWSLGFPVFLFDRDWFRLKKVSVYDLAIELKPDNSQEAPEIIQYQQLLKEGLDPLLAIQECWNEFGIEDFYRSLRNSSEWESKGNNGWTFKKYAELVVGYRKTIENKQVRVPIIILGRTPKEDHQLDWISEEYISELKT
ncbi:hypothetical protein [Prochlorococcus marinus]|uniref:Uncharacterized protein n=1 Tax=Prochlorococcus marinus XMU1408 TaxID=2213228 RepID=A0A318R3Y4_PROMR|nr:hypothetical protein [Prochlorococcus marinus]MBW3042228.1 hypothetical protein [Prochlorococcus marinus str. XMU1408]PYE01714.1 hypothetical protein DNJ73_05920 [Prochlorococcus marinus XMU1408]